MAHLTDAKMREMQAEMDRFEKELAGQMPTASYIAPPPAPPVNLVSAGLQNNSGSSVISAQTFHQVQRQLFVPPPPPHSSSGPRSLPLFVPHQIKRNVVPPPPPPSTGNFRPPPSNLNPSTMRPSPPQFDQRFSRPSAPVIAAPPRIISAPPKIIYSAAPVLNKKTEDPKKEDSISKSSASSSPAAATTSRSASPAPAVSKSATPPAPAPIQQQSQPHQQQQQRQPQPFPDYQHPQYSQPGPSNAAGPAVGGDAAGKKNQKVKKDRRLLRMAGGETWEDQTLAEWDPDDFRIFVGDLGNEVSDEHLTRAFGKYPTFQKAKVVRDKRTNKSKGFGFVSFKDPQDFIRAMRELNGKYIGNRPMKLRKSNWKDRNLDVVRKKDKEKKKLGLR